MQVSGNFSYLLIALIGFLILTGVQAEYSTAGDRYFLSLAFSATMIIGIWSIVHLHRWFVVGLILLVINVLSMLLKELGGLYWAEYLNLVSILLFYFLTTFLAFKALLYGDEVDKNKIMGSICVYLLVGISWGILFYLENRVHPGAFRGLASGDGKDGFIELLYYSYVTISTLGYGDITPVSPVARTLAFIEALFGQFYIAILVAGFVGLHLGSHRRKHLPPAVEDGNRREDQKKRP